ncbi:MAG: hypothetical protein LVQ96_05065 [Thermoplasmatales archaeon]|nr:hypothetical protein [Thermoplasmatales archaeon]MCW6170522.1 hypothetical protein [Thermoplasmatales archaeon]
MNSAETDHALSLTMSNHDDLGHANKGANSKENYGELLVIFLLSGQITLT